MKYLQHFLLVMLVCLPGLTQAQLNLSLVGSRSYSVSLSDIWGYTDANGREYALVGARDGVSVVDLSDPTQPTEVGFAPGDPSIWRDIKVWGDYAYVTCDQGDDGLMVIDLSNLPNGITYYLYRPELTLPSATDTLERAHNIWIDENGIAYVSGANVGNRGVLFFDVATTPGTPVYLGAVDAEYAHDCFARGDTLYTADIYGGYFSVYDVSNKATPVFLGSQTTPSLFAHNLWLSDDSRTLFTTDEKPDAFVGAYDVSDPSNIQELDRFRPDSTLGQGVIPHNVHVWDDYLIISYYTDGCIIVDASRPHNLIEVGNFDTYLPANTGFNGAWGAYPYFPSGLVAISDIGNGLYILQPNYQRACYLEGRVTDASNGNGLFNATISINNTLRTEDADNSGNYATGYAVAGTYSVTYSAPGYQSQTLNVTLSNGVVTVQDVQLVPLVAFTFTGQVTDAQTSQPIDSAIVEFIADGYEYRGRTDASGNFSIPNFYEGTYTMTAGRWGYFTQSSAVTVSATQTPNVQLFAGYMDPFALDLGWEVTGGANTGMWERAEPAGIFAAAYGQVVPDEDVANDIGNQCYVTGNGGAGPGANDVDNGNTIVTSPVMDLSGYSDPILRYSYWFVNVGGNTAPDDALTVQIEANGQWYTVNTHTGTTTDWSTPQHIRISDVVTPTSNMRIRFETSDFNTSGHVVEAAIDDVQVYDSVAVNTTQLPAFNWSIAPNPSATDFLLATPGTDWPADAQVTVFNALGQAIETHLLTATTLRLGASWIPGVYVIRLSANGETLDLRRVVKQ